MKKLDFLIMAIAILLCSVIIITGQQLKSVIEAKPGVTVKMPAEYSTQLGVLQEQSKKLEKDYDQVVTLFKEYAAKRDAIQAQAAVLITRAALAAHMTIEQLDNSDLKVDDKGNYSWVPKSEKTIAKPEPKKEP